MIFKRLEPEIVKILKAGGVGITPTDTIYGLVGSALNKKTVARIYRLRKRNLKKPMIVLVGSISELKKFRISLPSTQYRLVSKFWPGKVSVIFKCPSPKFRYLHRGTKSLAIRLPQARNLAAFLRKTGPLVAPSANLEGRPPASTVKAARSYFGDNVDFYVDGGRRVSKPSRLIKIKNGKVIELRD